MTESFKAQFNELKVIGQRSAMSAEEKREKDLKLISFLQSSLDNDELTTIEDIGFAYWNISDNFALLRDNDGIYNNHRQFANFLSNKPSIYLYWLVLDATQRFTLELGEHDDFWWQLYKNATASNPDYLGYAAFCAHRTALSNNPRVKADIKNTAYAAKCFAEFIEHTKYESAHSFYKIIYLSLTEKNIDLMRSELLSLSNELILGIRDETQHPDYLVGEWKKYTEPPVKSKQSSIGICSAVNAFIRYGDIKTASCIYEKARREGLKPNYYIESRLY